MSTSRGVKGSVLANMQCSFAGHPKSPISGTRGAGPWAGNENR